MATVATAAIGRVLRAAQADGQSDRELLRRFAERNDQSAFATLVQRHAGLVLGVCRRALAQPADAEDACQATFLILSRKAKTGSWQPSVANWLYVTARRVAHNARVAAERRAKRERRAALTAVAQPLDRMTGRELLAALIAGHRGKPAAPAVARILDRDSSRGGDSDGQAAMRRGAVCGPPVLGWRRMISSSATRRERL
jgi:Sigma-70 region 2